MAFWNKKKKTPQEYILAGNYNQAIKAFRNELKNKKNDPSILLQMGNCYMKLGDKTKAKKIFVKVGSIYGDQGFFNKSVASFKKALNITPDDQGILEKLAGYNDKVPKFMIDENFLKRADIKTNPKESDQKQEPQTKPTAPQETDMEGGIPLSPENPEESIPLAVEETTDAAKTEEAEVNNSNSETETKPKANNQTDPVANPADEEEPNPFQYADVPDGEAEAVDFGEADPSEAQDQFVPGIDPVEPNYDAFDKPVEQDTYEEITDLSGDTIDDLDTAEDEPVQATPTEQKPETVSGPLITPNPDDDTFNQLIEFEELTGEFPQLSKADLLALKEAATQSSGESKEEPPNRAVFKSQKPVEDKPASGVFNSLDDALDTLFTSGPDSIPPNRDENQKHWPLFRTMPSKVFMDFVMALEGKDYEADEYIVKEGDSGNEMFLIAEGEVVIEVAIDGKTLQVAKLKEGDFFGEASLLTGSPRNASVKATSQASCLLLNRSHLNELNKSHPSVMASIETIYYTRLEQNASHRR